MTNDELKLLDKLAHGPIDAYDLHHARPVLGNLLVEYRALLQECELHRDAARKARVQESTASTGNSPRRY